MKKRVIALGDLHCGHMGGLTPPGWQADKERLPAIRQHQQNVWGKYAKLARQYTKGYDGKIIVVCNGDAIDGTRNVGECLTNDRTEQVAMAAACLSKWGADEYFFTGGTPVHTGKEEHWEKVLASRFDAALHPALHLDVNGRLFYFRHKVGRSSVFHGRHTAPAKVRLWQELGAERDKASIICLSHVHYHTVAGGPDGLAMTLPALQTFTDYGTRECDGHVDWGIVVFDVDERGEYDWKAKTTRLEPFIENRRQA